MILTLPIYYTQTFKRKEDKTWLVGDNAYRNWHYFLKNEVKQYYHTLIKDQIDDTKIAGQFKLSLNIYLKNINSDPSNVASRIEKFALDGLQEAGVIVNDNGKYHIGTYWEFCGVDKENPRCTIELIPINT